MTGAKGSWPFLDPPNTAVFTTLGVLDGDDWVHCVSHDQDDGAWQFHSLRGPASLREAALVSLEQMLRVEPGIEELADLPAAWHAWRDDENGPWTRAPKPAG